MTQLPFGYSKLQKQCCHQADAGVVCPLVMVSPTLTIAPYFDIDSGAKIDIIIELEKEWPEYTDQFIEKNFSCGDMLYVATNTRGEVVGCVAVDRKRFQPFISSLLVVGTNRGKGYGGTLLAFAETYIKQFGFNVSHLWCSQDMIPYYQKRGYEVEAEEKSAFVMVKKI